MTRRGQTERFPRPRLPGLMHRIGGIEKGFATGDISYEPDNHQKMTDTRKAKIDRIGPQQEVPSAPFPALAERERRRGRAVHREQCSGA
jgi:hypothetical protein